MTLQSDQVELFQDGIEDAESTAHQQSSTAEGAGEEQLELTLEGGSEPDVTAAPITEESLGTGDDVPTQYHGKSAADLLDIIRNKDELNGRQSNELGSLRDQVGTLRGVVDQAISMQAGTSPGNKDAEREALSADDLLQDPDAAIARGVQEAMAPINDRLDRMASHDRQASFLQAHSTAMEDVNDDKFVDYVKGSAYRTRLAEKAFQDMNNIDFDAAEELWLGYDDVRGEASTPSTPKATHAAKPDPSEVSLVTSGGSGAEATSDKTIYSAAALTQLQMTDPDKYYEPNFYAKIATAWAEQRVR